MGLNLQWKLELQELKHVHWVAKIQESVRVDSELSEQGINRSTGRHPGSSLSPPAIVDLQKFPRDDSSMDA